LIDLKIVVTTVDMSDPQANRGKRSAAQKALRAQRIIYIVMFVFILLPFIVVWMTGSLSF
jgi:hypothetical protein